MGLFGNIVIYQLGKRSANRKRDRRERRAKFAEEWRDATDPYRNGVPDDDCDCDVAESD